VEVPVGVFVLRAVTTPNVPTNRAEAQIHLRVPDLQAVITAIRDRLNRMDFIDWRCWKATWRGGSMW
jgi:hypothetical protein